MSAPLPPLRLTGAHVLRDGKLVRRSVAIRDGRFAAGPFSSVDLSGYYILPGIVDIHHSGLALNGTSGNAARAFRQADRDAASHGVTTRYLSLPWSWDCPANGPSAAGELAACWLSQAQDRLTDLRLALCSEVLMTDHEDDLLALARSGAIGQVLFSDFARQLEDAISDDAARLVPLADRKGTDAASLVRAFQAVSGRRPMVPRHLCRLAERFDDLDLSYGSIGDQTAETREHYSMIGASICMMPGSIRVASAARAVGDPVAIAAGELLHCDRGGNGPRPTEWIRRRVCDALVSDTDSAAPVRAVFHLVDKDILPLERAWRLVSDIPADILRLPDRGRIERGKRADLTVVNIATRRVEATIAGGRISYLSGEAAARFMGCAGSLGLAAE